MSNAIRKCSPREASAVLRTSGEGQLVDVRERSEHRTERVPGAILIPLSRLDSEAVAVDPARPIYLLCKSGARAMQAARQLAARGFMDLRVVEGGLKEWAAEGCEVERGDGNVWALERQVRFVAGSLVLAGILLSVVSPWFMVIAGLIGAGLTFSAATDTCAMGMVLARMPWNQKA